MFALLRKLSPRQMVVLMALAVMSLSFAAVGAQTPEPALSSSDLITTGTDLIQTFGIMAVITAGAIIGIAVYLFKRFKTGAR